MTTLGSYLTYIVHGSWPERNRKPKRKARRGPIRSFKYRAFVRAHPCCACHSRRQVEAAHTGAHGISQKAPDLDCVPLCLECHQVGRDALHHIGPIAFQRLHRISFQRIISELREEWSNLEWRREP
jgi:hypothetical protein